MGSHVSHFAGSPIGDWESHWTISNKMTAYEGKREPYSGLSLSPFGFHLSILSSSKPGLLCMLSVKENVFWLFLYSTILRSRVYSLRSHVTLHEWIAFYSAFLNIHQSGVLTALAWLVPYETAAVSAQVLCTPYNHAPCHFMQSHMHMVYVCLAVTCHLHFWQNDRGLLRATAVTQGWNWYRDKSQPRKLTMKKKILWPLLQGVRTCDLSITSPAL